MTVFPEVVTLVEPAPAIVTAGPVADVLMLVIPPLEQPDVVAPPFASVQSDAPVPLTVPELRTLLSVPWSAFEEVIVVALPAMPTCPLVKPEIPPLHVGRRR